MVRATAVTEQFRNAASMQLTVASTLRESLAVAESVRASLGLTAMSRITEGARLHTGLYEQAARAARTWQEFSATAQLQTTRLQPVLDQAARNHRAFAETVARTSERLVKQNATLTAAAESLAVNLSATSRVQDLLASLPRFTSSEWSQLQSVWQSSAEAALVSPVEENELSVDAAPGALERAVAAAEAEGAAHPLTAEAFWRSLPWSVRMVLLAILLPLWEYMITSMIQGVVSSYSRAQTDEERQHILVYVHQELGADAGDNLRTVNASSLLVRAGPGKEAPIVGGLARGVLVTVVEIQSAWAHVLYPVAESATLQTGWVASGHLRKLPAPASRGATTQNESSQ